MLERPASRRGHDVARRQREITAFTDFPEAQWRKIWSTNPLDRLHREVKRSTDVVGLSPNAAALLRLSATDLPDPVNLSSDRARDR